MSETLRLRRQWLIAPDEADVPAGWETYPLDGSLTLHCHPETRVSWQRGPRADVAFIGIGYVDGSRAALDACLAEVAAGSRSLVDLAPSIAGTYAIIVREASDVRVYTDPAALMSVYLREGRAASSPALLGPLRRDAALDRVFPFGSSNDWYPGDLVPFGDVRVLLANHVFSFTSRRTERFWPSDPFPVDADGSAGIKRLASLIERNVVGIAANGRLAVSVTGGRDSRVNVAALSHAAIDADYFTIAGESVKRCDQEIPAMIAARLDLRHRFIQNRPADPEILSLYDEMTLGLAIGGRRDVVGAVSELASTGCIHLNGNLGALCKAYYWRRGRGQVTSQTVAKRLRDEFPYRSRVVDRAIGGWVATVPKFLPAPQAFNLMYLEQRGGRWMAPGETAGNLIFESATPFASREIFSAVSSLPPDVLAKGDVLVRLARELCPSLDDIPYCTARNPISRYLPASTREAVRRLLRRTDRRS